MAAARVEESDVLRLEAAANVNVEALVPPAVLVNADSVTVEGSGVPEFVVPAVLVVLVVEGDELLDPARAEVWAGTGGAVPVIPKMPADVSTSVVASRVAENEVLLLEAAADADMEGLVPSALLVNAVFATTEGSEGSVFATLVVLEVDGDELLDSAGSAVLAGAGSGGAMTLVVIGRVDTCGRVAAADADADDDAPLLKTFADGVGETGPGILELFDRDSTWVAAARVSENDMILLEDAVNVNVEVLVPPAGLVYAISVTAEGSGAEFAAPAALAVLDVEGDELLDPARAEVRVGTGVVVAMITVLLDHVDASTLVPIVVAKDGALLLKACVNGVRRAVPVIPEMAADVSTSVVASRVAEDEVLDTANADVEGLVPSAVLVNAVSATIEGSEESVFVTLAVLEVDGDKLLDSAGAVVLITAADLCRRSRRDGARDTRAA